MSEDNNRADAAALAFVTDNLIPIGIDSQKYRNLVVAFEQVEADAYARGRDEAAEIVNEWTQQLKANQQPQWLVESIEKLTALILASSPGPSHNSELLDAIEGLLITFVYENPLPPDLEETTRDAHVAVAEELLIHHGRESFVQSRVDRPSLEERLRAEIAERVAALVKPSRDEVNDSYNRALDDALAAIRTRKEEGR